jgi:hypothetical protein
MSGSQPLKGQKETVFVDGGMTLYPEFARGG